MSKIHPYLPNSVPEIKEKMMEKIGINTINELFSDIPKEFIYSKELSIPGPHSEVEVKQHLEKLLEQNKTLKCPPFLGGGIWPHYVPTIVEEVVHRAEFLTSYTPYQPEISQGILQAIFEYQSLICELVGMEVANASMYDAGSAAAEAVLQATTTIFVPCWIRKAVIASDSFLTSSKGRGP